MAQTKTRSSSKGSAGKSKPRKAKSSSSKARSSNRSSGSKAKSQAGRSNGSGRAEAAKEAVRGSAKGAGQTAKEAGKTVGRAAGKAKVPLVASGAALVGAAGGLAMGARTRRPKGLAKAMQRRPRVKVKSRDVKHAAKEVGSLGAQMGRLASELQSAREESNGKHRSPIEVVLQGLTTRGSRR